MKEISKKNIIWSKRDIPINTNFVQGHFVDFVLNILSVSYYHSVLTYKKYNSRDLLKNIYRTALN